MRNLSVQALANIKAYNAKYRKEHRQEIRAKSRKYYQEHCEEQLLKYGEYRQTNREKIRTSNKPRNRWYGLKARYGLSKADYEALLKKQGGFCAICGRANWNGRGPHVDHDHATGKVRGILCGGCNTALGLIYEEIDISKSMTKYLKKLNNFRG